MANSLILVPFIKGQEGGLSKNTSDKASLNPVPDNSGYHTNKGITWLVWSSVFGIDSDSIQRFYTMSDSDWNRIYKPLYWDVALGDQINSQRIANLIVDWIWGSGKHYPEMYIQDIIVHIFNENISIDGDFGPATIKSINEADEQKLFDSIVNKRFSYLQDIVKSTPTNQIFYNGWVNRMNALINFSK